MPLTQVQSGLLESGAALNNISAGTITPSYLNTQAQYTGFKNRIINGAMVIDQRNAGAAVTVDGAATYITDRFIVQDFSDAVLSAQRVSDAPAGFVNSLRVTVTTADASLGATQGARVNQRIEGFNIADLGWGTASASTVTLSFWVKSSLTGTFGGSLQTETGGRAYPYTYTITSANTWEQKSITIVGDTSGTWNTTNGVGVIVQWGLGMGSTYSGTAGSWASGDFLSATGAVSVVGTLNATFQITGVQLEKGSTATSFDYRPYGTELQLCQRYFIGFPANSIFFGYSFTTTDGVYTVPLFVPMRTTPISTSVPANFDCRSGNNGGTTPSAVNLSTASNYIVAISAASTGFTAGQGTRLTCNTNNALTLSAEL